jgi:hypothetical protein
MIMMMIHLRCCCWLLIMIMVMMMMMMPIMCPPGCGGGLQPWGPVGHGRDARAQRPRLPPPEPME